MDKEKILEKARAENKDEGFSNSKTKGLNLGYKIFLILNIILIIFNLIRGQDSSAIMSLFWGFVAADAYSRYKFFNEKIDLITIVAASIACIVFLINHFLYSFR